MSKALRAQCASTWPRLQPNNRAASPLVRSPSTAISGTIYMCLTSIVQILRLSRTWPFRVISSFYAFPLSAVLTIGFAFKTFPEPRPWTTAPFWIWLLSLLVTTLMIACRLLTRSKPLRSELKNYSQAFWTFGAYLAGLVVATAVRVAKGPLDLTEFYQQGVPVIAGFVVAIVFQQTRGSNIDKAGIRAREAGIRAREVTVVYVLTGPCARCLG
jgi:hypothetical protein